MACQRTSILLVSLLWLAGPALAQQPDRALVETLRAIYQLRDYTAFDWISGSYERGTLTLQGMVRTNQLKDKAEELARKSAGVDEVVNAINILPSHLSDDDVRLRVYVAIYGAAGLERYGPGGQMSGAALRELLDTARFGLDGTDVGRGPHAIHVLVSGGRVILRGEVRSRGDRQIAEASARTTSGVLRVTNQLRVAGEQ